MSVISDDASTAAARVGRREEALACAEEAVAILRPLAQRYPARFAESLAGASRNLEARRA